MPETSKSARALAPCAAIMLLTACGGGSSGSPPGPGVTTYDVSVTAGTGGTVSPSSEMVNAGGTTTFTVTVYGLKYGEGFGFTHLGRIGRAAGPLPARA